MLVFLSLLLIPLSQACTTPPPKPPSQFWLSRCDIFRFWTLPFPGQNYCSNNLVPNNCMWVGVEVGLFGTGSTATTCACGLRAPQSSVQLQGIQITRVKVLWTCKTPEYYLPLRTSTGDKIVFNFTPSPTSGTINQQTIAAGLAQAFGTSTIPQTTFAFQSIPPILIPDSTTIPNPSNWMFGGSIGGPYLCPTGWIIKLWFYICGTVRPGNFNIQVGAGAPGVPNHEIGSLNPEVSFIGTVGGDIHLLTLDGVRYTFNARGDFIYARTKQKDFEVQVRTTMTKKGSVLSAVGIRDYISDDVIELWWNGTSSHDLVADGRNRKDFIPGTPLNPKDQHHLDFVKFGSKGDAETRFGDFELVKNEHLKSISIGHKRWGKDFHLDAYYGGKATFTMKVPEDWEIEGLAGNKNGVKYDDLCFREKERNGCLSLNATSAQIHAFGLSWKAGPYDLLFQKWMSVKGEELEFKQLQYTKEELDAAGKHCGVDKSCLYDYLSTGSEEFATNTLHDSIELLFKDITNVGDELH